MNCSAAYDDSSKVFHGSGHILKSNHQKRPDSAADRFLHDMLNQSPDFSRGETRITFEVGKGLLIEGVRNVCEYTQERLIVSTYSRSIVIEGCCLCLCRMMEDSIVICGKIDTVKFL